MNKNQQLVLNLSASFVAYGVTLFINFFVSPYIVGTIGVEANGFITLANNFVSYASLITVALNSLAGRFITISVVQGDDRKANIYFSSVFYANLIITLVVGTFGLFIVAFLEQIINVPESLVSDVRLLFICLFLNCLISIAGSVFTVATFARNKLYLESLRTIEANIARAVIILGAFLLFKPKVWYVGLGSLVSGIYVLCCNLYYTIKLLPGIQVQRKYYSRKAVWELISSGIWNTINRLGQLLADGLDLLITNLLIDVTAMGVLSLAKTVPGLISGLMGTVVGVFSPDFTFLYAEKKYEELLYNVKRSMKIMGLITNLPIIILIVCGQEFFILWQPTQDPKTLQILSLLTIGMLIFSGGINCLYNLFTVFNKVKINSIVVVVTSLVSTVLVLILLKMTSLGIYAVAGVSTVLTTLRNIFFTAPYGAYCLKQKWYVFYPDIFRPAVFVLVSVIVCMITIRFQAANWFMMFIKAGIVGMISLTIGYLIVLNKSDRKYIEGIIQNKRKNKSK